LRPETYVSEAARRRFLFLKTCDSYRTVCQETRPVKSGGSGQNAGNTWSAPPPIRTTAFCESYTKCWTSTRKTTGVAGHDRRSVPAANKPEQGRQKLPATRGRVNSPQW